jgi:hypothetical protein
MSMPWLTRLVGMEKTEDRERGIREKEPKKSKQ